MEAMEAMSAAERDKKLMEEVEEYYSWSGDDKFIEVKESPLLLKVLNLQKKYGQFTLDYGFIDQILLDSKGDEKITEVCLDYVVNVKNKFVFDPLDPKFTANEEEKENLSIAKDLIHQNLIPNFWFYQKIEAKKKDYDEPTFTKFLKQKQKNREKVKEFVDFKKFANEKMEEFFEKEKQTKKRANKFFHDEFEKERKKLEEESLQQKQEVEEKRDKLVIEKLLIKEFKEKYPEIDPNREKKEAKKKKKEEYLKKQEEFNRNEDLRKPWREEDLDLYDQVEAEEAEEGGVQIEFDDSEEESEVDFNIDTIEEGEKKVKIEIKREQKEDDVEIDDLKSILTNLEESQKLFKEFF